MADAECNFILVDIGGFGRDNDSKIFSESDMGKAFNGNKLNIPAQQNIIGTGIEMPFYFVGDKAFPLRTNLMRPYARRQLNNEKRLFNYRLSRARRTVECAFGILVKKFGLFTHSISTSLKLGEASIKSACVLHNYTWQRQNETERNLEREFLDQTNVPPLIGLRPTPAHRGGTETIETRNKLTAYFSR